MASAGVTVADVLLVALGGALGSVARYGAGILCATADGRLSSTMLVNIAGCLLIGIVTAILTHFDTAPSWRLLVVTGFLGGFTTYSTFTLDIVTMLHAGRYATAAGYVAATFSGGLAACIAAMAATTRLLKIL